MTGPQSTGGQTPAPASGGMLARLDPSELLIVAGAALLLVIGELIAVILFTGVGFSSVITVAAVGALVTVYLKQSRRVQAWPVPYRVVLTVLCGVVGVAAVEDLLITLTVLGSIFDDVWDVISILSLYGGAVLMGLGAMGLWQRSSSSRA